MKNRILAIAVLLAAVVFTGCKEDELMLYNGGDRACFWNHTQTFSFYGASESALPKDTIELEINLMGNLSDHDRVVTGEAYIDPAGTPEDEKKTDAPTSKYRILGGVIPANSVEGRFYVEVQNADADAEKTYKMRLIITESEEIGPGLAENYYIDLSWSRKLLKPSTWNAMRFFFCSVYSTEVYRIIIESCGIHEFYYYDADPATGRALSQYEGWILGKKFSDYCWAYKEQHGTFPLHDDGTNAGMQIEPIIQ